MNILLLNHYAGSPEMGMEFRPYYLAREWVRMGHAVTIVAGDYSHLRQKNPSVYADFAEEPIDGITYVWVRTGAYEGNGAERAFTMFRFVRKLWAHAGMLVHRYQPDVVIASSTYPLDTYAAQRIARLAGARYVHEVHDMWPTTLIEIGNMSRFHPFVMLMGVAEESFCRHSDAIVSLLPAANTYFLQHGMKVEAFNCVMNGVVEEEWRNPEPIPRQHTDAISAFRNDKEIVICFFGSHTKSYALDQLIEAVNCSKHNVGAVFVGGGQYKDHLIQTASKYEGNRILFLPPVNKMAVPSLLREMDVLYVGALHNDMFRFGICMNKLFDSMMAGKPILYAVDAPNNLIEDYECGISVLPENIDALITGIDELANMNMAERNRLGANGRKAVLEHFTYKKLAEQFLRVLESNEI